MRQNVMQGWYFGNRVMNRHRPEFCGYVIAAAAIIGVGTSIYSVVTAPDAPQTQTPPPPPNSTVYGDDGEILSRQVFDSEKNEWITYGPNSEPQKPKEIKPGEAGYDQYQTDLADYNVKHDKWEADKAQRAADKEKLAGIRTQALDNLNQTPADRLAAYDEYAQKFADSAHRTADPAFDKALRGEEERANATGMMGSRAYVDTKAELADVKAQQDTDISTQAALAKEQLAANDRNYWANLLSQIDAGARADAITSAQVGKTSSDIASQNYAGTMGYYGALNNNRLTEWEAKRQKNAAISQVGSSTANGLLYLYGGMKGGGGAGGGYSGGGGYTGTSGIKPTNTGYGTYSLFG